VQLVKVVPSNRETLHLVANHIERHDPSKSYLRSRSQALFTCENCPLLVFVSASAGRASDPEPALIIELEAGTKHKWVSGGIRWEK